MKNGHKHQIAVYRKNQRTALGLDRPGAARPFADVLDAEWEECQPTDLSEVVRDPKGGQVFINKLVVNHYHREAGRPVVRQEPPVPAAPEPIDNWTFGVFLGGLAFCAIGIMSFVKALFTLGGIL